MAHQDEGRGRTRAPHPAQTASIETARDLMDEVLDLRVAITRDADALIARLNSGSEHVSPQILNLAHYLALRHHDVRPLQRRLMRLGLSSLGRLESRVLPTLDAVLAALAAMAHRPVPFPVPGEKDFFAGETALGHASQVLLGPPPKNRRTYIMVTLPTEAATDPDLVLTLARNGMDVARINCAHDDNNAWRAMTENVRRAGETTGRRISVFMDIAGPKIRTGPVGLPAKKAKLQTGDAIRLVAGDTPRTTPDIPFSASVSLPDMISRLSLGDRVLYDDGKLECIVESLGEGEAVLRVAQARTGGVKLKPEKGLNLPDTALGLSPLTTKDEDDLKTVIECADMIGYSFVSEADDIDLLEEALIRCGASDRPLGLVAKIERPEAVSNLPDILIRAAIHRPFGVMIARGDLAAELGFGRLAEMQEELLWICEAAGVPVIWATQVLEDLVKDGVPSRGEMTDAAMASRAECVMLNKGPAIVEAVQLLDGLLERMDDHLFKKTPTLRALKSW